MSVIVTLVTALVGIGFGLFSGSAAVVFDGVYSLADAAMTLLALGVARLIAASNAADASGGRLHQRFTMGFWHLEPIVLGVNGALLTGAAIYAFVNAIGVLVSGGQPLAFDAALIYAGVATVAQVSMAVYVARANRTIGSRLVALDAQAWVMTSALSLALFVAFLLGYLIQGTRYAWMAPYVDPAALLVISLAIIPVPLATVRDALADILLMTPQDLRDSVDRTAAGVVERYGFLSYRAYVARVGRGTQIELHFIAPPAWPAKTLEEWDALREEIGAALGQSTADRWLTIAFTTNPNWAA